jgi:ESS family glutamate:Na+ symporter
MMVLSQVLIDLAIISLFLVLGTIVRQKITAFQRYVIPASVLGGLIGLVVGKNVLGLLPISDNYAQFGIIGIDIVFACLFLGRKIPGIGQLGKSAGAQTAYAYFNGFGQIAIGLLVVIAFGSIGYSLHPMFGLQLLVGFQGGVGIGTAVAPMLAELGWSASEAAAVGETCAVAGLAMSVVIGIVIINIGIARNLTVKKFHESGQKIQSPTFKPPEARQYISQEITSPEAASSFVFNFGFVGMAILCGHLIRLGIVSVAPPLKIMPTFPFILVGGIIVQVLLQKTRFDSYIDRNTVETISGFALDVLIVASLMAIKPSVVMAYATPLTVMVILGLMFNLWQLKWLGPRILPGAWFEKGVCEYAQSTGSVPQAMLLLRMVDPRLETDAAEAFALKMLFFSPVMFPISVILAPIIVARGPLLFFGIYCALMIIILAICRATCWQDRPKEKWLASAV